MDSIAKEKILKIDVNDISKSFISTFEHTKDRYFLTSPLYLSEAFIYACKARTKKTFPYIAALGAFDK